MPLRILLLPLLVWSSLVWGKQSGSAPSAEPDWAEFRQFCLIHRMSAETLRLPRPPIGEVSFIPVAALENQQKDFSFVRLRQQLKKGIKESGTRYNEKKERWIFTADKGRSLFDQDSDLVGVFYRGRVYLADGHHKALASIYMGAVTAPVHIIDDWSEKTPQEFHQAMKDAGFSHWKNHRGQSIRPVSFCAMEDNPNLMLARLLIRRIQVRMEHGARLKIKVGSGSHQPIALKINHDIPFMEKEIADALSRAGVRFDDLRGDLDIDWEERAHYLSILTKVARRHPRLKHILLLKSPSKFEDLDLEPLLLEHLHSPGCEDKLLARSY